MNHIAIAISVKIISYFFQIVKPYSNIFKPVEVKNTEHLISLKMRKTQILLMTVAR